MCSPFRLSERALVEYHPCERLELPVRCAKLYIPKANAASALRNDDLGAAAPAVPVGSGVHRTARRSPFVAKRYIIAPVDGDKVFERPVIHLEGVPVGMGRFLTAPRRLSGDHAASARAAKGGGSYAGSSSFQMSSPYGLPSRILKMTADSTFALVIMWTA